MKQPWHADSEAMQANNKNPEDGSGYYFPAVATNKITVAGPDGGQMYTATCASQRPGSPQDLLE